LAGGGLVAFPTETVYGLAASAASEHAMARLRDLKQRPNRPFTVHIATPEQSLLYVAAPPLRARWLMKKAWPGPVTVVLTTGGKLAQTKWGDEIAERICYQGSVALRCPDHPLATALLAAVANPVVAPSANLTGKKPPVRPQDVLAQLDGQIDLLLEGGPTRLGEASTIVAFEQDGKVNILRAGIYERRTIENMMQKQILFVCTGNTCRSPIAEGITRMELSRRLACKVDELAQRGWNIVSAGTMAFGGSAVSAEAIQAAARLGANIEGHKNRLLTTDLIDSSDLIFCMTDQHLQEVVRQCPAAARRAHLLDAGGNIADPIGESVRVYSRGAEQLRRAILGRMDMILS